MLTQSLRCGWRSARSTPGSSLVIVVTLGVVMAAALIVFSVLNATLLAPLPVKQPDRIVALRYGYGQGGGAASPPLFLDHRRALTSFESLSAAMPFGANVTGDGDPERLQGLLVSGDFFSTFGVDALQGRLLRPEEEQPGRERVVVISHGLWQRRFGGRANAIGSRLQMNGDSYEIVGIAPPTFTWGRAYGRPGVADLWAPFALTPARIAENQRGSEFLDVYGRLKSSSRLEQAQAEIDKQITDLRARYARRYTVASGFHILVLPIHEELTGEVRSTVVAVFFAVLSLVLIAATNVAGLLVARASGRHRELSVHAALGAGRARLVANGFGEAAVLAIGSAMIALPLAWLGMRLLDSVDQAMLPRAQAIALDPMVTWFAVALTSIVLLLAGAIPSWHALRADLVSSLRVSSQNTAAHSSRAGRALIVAQTAATLALLVGAGLLIQSLARLDDIRPGFRDDVIAAQIQLPRATYADGPARVQFAQQLLAQIATKPGLTAGLVSELPLSGQRNSSSFDIEGRVVAPTEKEPHAEHWSASPEYFSVLGIPLRQGRGFDDRDALGRTEVAIVNDALVQRYFPGIDPLSMRIDFDGTATNPRWLQIVGVVGDVRDRGLDTAAEPQVYLPYAQRPSTAFFVVARGPGEPLSLVPQIRAAVAARDRTLPIYNVTTVAALRGVDTRNRCVAGVALSSFSLAALFVACLGIYGLVAHSVRERRREIGVRVAIGAAPSSVLRLFMSEVGSLIGIGVAVGIALAIPATRLLRTMVFDVSTTDPATYAMVSAFLLVAGGAAAAVPAWRGSRVDPVSALRS